MIWLHLIWFVILSIGNADVLVTTVNRLPYPAAMCREVGGDPKRLVRRCWPDAYEWLVDMGFTGQGISASYDISKARRILGWQPVFNFEEAHAGLISQ